MLDTKIMPYKHLRVFSIQALAPISEWLDEVGELCVDMYDGIWTDQYFIRSMKDLRLLVLEQSYRYRVFYTIYRTTTFSLRGFADEQLLERALREFPDGEQFHFVEFGYYPERIRGIEVESDHRMILTLIERSWGYPIALGHGSLLWDQSIEAIPTLEVNHNPTGPQTRAAYAPYDADPTRYQWIVDMWKE